MDGVGMAFGSSPQFFANVMVRHALWACFLLECAASSIYKESWDGHREWWDMFEEDVLLGSLQHIIYMYIHIGDATKFDDVTDNLSAPLFMLRKPWPLSVGMFQRLHRCTASFVHEGKALEARWYRYSKLILHGGGIACGVNGMQAKKKRCARWELAPRRDHGHWHGLSERLALRTSCSSHFYRAWTAFPLPVDSRGCSQLTWWRDCRALWWVWSTFLSCVYIWHNLFGLFFWVCNMESSCHFRLQDRLMRSVGADGDVLSAPCAYAARALGNRIWFENEISTYSLLRDTCDSGSCCLELGKSFAYSLC